MPYIGDFESKPHGSQGIVLASVRANGSMSACAGATHHVALELVRAHHMKRDVFREGFTMSRFDQDTSTMRMRMENTLIELRKPEIGPQSKARGIMVGALLGALAWAAIITLAMAVWRWLA